MTMDGTRGKEHGTHSHSYDEHAGIMMSLVRIYMNARNWKTMPDAQKESFIMTALKQARILSGQADFADHWVDIVGYNKLVADALIRREQEKREDAHPENDPSTTPSTPRDEGLSIHLRDGVMSLTPPDFVVLFRERGEGWLVDRNAYSEKFVDHLPRHPIAATTKEYESMPRYYRPLYVSEPNPDGRWKMLPAYHERWGK